MDLSFSFRTKALENPQSIIESDIAMNIVIIAKTPYSDGDNRFAKTMPTKKEITEFAILSTKLQLTPLSVLFFRDVASTSNLFHKSKL